MVSLNLLFVILALTFLANLVVAQPLDPSESPKDTPSIVVDKTKFCKDADIGKDFEQYVTIDHIFKKTEAKDRKDGRELVDIIDMKEITQFNSTLQFDKDTFVNYVFQSGAVVTKSGYQEAPKRMRFSYSYKNSGDQKKRVETAYVEVDIYGQCTVEGSDQWPNLDEVSYFSIPESLPSKG